MNLLGFLLGFAFGYLTLNMFTVKYTCGYYNTKYNNINLKTLNDFICPINIH